MLRDAEARLFGPFTPVCGQVGQQRLDAGNDRMDVAIDLSRPGFGHAFTMGTILLYFECEV